MQDWNRGTRAYGGAWIAKPGKARMCMIDCSFEELQDVPAWRFSWVAPEMGLPGPHSGGAAWSCCVDLVCAFLKDSLMACGSVAQLLCHGTEVC